mgnify:CR=1 FL=1
MSLLKEWPRKLKEIVKNSNIYKFMTFDFDKVQIYTAIKIFNKFLEGKRVIQPM